MAVVIMQLGHLHGSSSSSSSGGEWWWRRQRSRKLFIPAHRKRVAHSKMHACISCLSCSSGAHLLVMLSCPGGLRWTS